MGKTFMEAAGIEPAKGSPGARAHEFLASGWVYLVSHGDAGPVKIGWTSDLRHRLSTLQTATPELLTVVALLPAPQAVESGLHRAFAAYRARGEWFDLPDDLLARILSLQLTEASWRRALGQDEPRRRPRSLDERADSHERLMESFARIGAETLALREAVLAIVFRELALLEQEREAA